MSVAGILDAMRSSYAPTVRLIWQCLENRANGARWWRMTDEDIANELHLSIDTVRVGIDVLERDRIVRAARHKRRPTTFYMLRTYPEGCPRPRHEPEIAARFAPALTPETPEPTAELTPEIPETLNPPEKNPPGREERAATASPPPPAPPPSPAFILPPQKEASRIEQGALAPPEPPRERATRWHDDVANDPDFRRTVREGGQDPDEIAEEIAVWVDAQPEPPIRPWVGFARRWVALKPRFDVRQDSRNRPRSAADAIAERYFGRAAA